MKTSPDNQSLSLGRRAELQQLLKHRAEIEERIALFSAVGKTSTEDVAKKIAKKIVMDMKKIGKNPVPETIQRMALKFAYQAIPKSNRGRKPHEQHPAAA
jgi:hypothetical protein